MIINKRLPFETAEDQAELQRLSMQIHSLTELDDNFGDVGENVTEQEACVYKYILLKMMLDERYFNSFNGNIAAVLADARDVLDAIDIQTDFFSYLDSKQKQYSEDMQRMQFIDPKERRKIENSLKRNYDNYYNFLSKCVGLQSRALARIYSERTGEKLNKLTKKQMLQIDGIAELQRLVEQRACYDYRKPDKWKPKKESLRLAFMTAPPASSSPFFSLPTGSAINLVDELLIHGGDLKTLPERKKTFNHSSTYTAQTKGDRGRLTVESDKSQITVEVANLPRLIGNNKPAKKIFAYTLIKANEQAIHNGILSRDYVTFSLQELVDIEMYSSVKTARKGFTDALDILTDIKINGEIQKTPKNKVTVIGAHPFSKGIIENSICTVKLDPDFNWSFIMQSFTILPKQAFSLSNRAFDLCQYIFIRARQSKSLIEKQGYFSISFRAIQERLALPSEVGNRKPQQQIKQPIEEAIEAIEDALKTTELEILSVVDESAPIKLWLDKGYLKVTLKGDFAKNFIEISKEQTKIISEKSASASSKKS